MGTTIQINSLEALERLIGGDSETEISIRNSVVQEFYKKHLKGIADTDIMRKTENAMQNTIKEMFFENLATARGQVIFKKPVLDKLKDDLAVSANQALTNVVSEAVKEMKAYEIINERLTLCVDHIIDQLSEKVLERRLEQMVDKRLKEKLNIQS